MWPAILGGEGGGESKTEEGVCCVLHAVCLRACGWPSRTCHRAQDTTTPWQWTARPGCMRGDLKRSEPQTDTHPWFLAVACMIVLACVCVCACVCACACACACVCICVCVTWTGLSLTGVCVVHLGASVFAATAVSPLELLRTKMQATQGVSYAGVCV